MNSEVEKKLNEILDKKYNNGTSRLSIEIIEDFEKRLNIHLPNEYKEFLTLYYSCYIKEDYYFSMIEKSKITSSNGMKALDYFYNSEFVNNAGNFISIWGNEVLPIGESSGDYICIGVQKNNFGKIFVLYHEDEERENGLYLAADSFYQFILSFKYIKSNSHHIDCIVELNI